MLTYNLKKGCQKRLATIFRSKNTHLRIYKLLANCLIKYGNKIQELDNRIEERSL